MVKPKSIWVSEASLVVQVMVAPEVVIFEPVRPEITGAVVSAADGVGEGAGEGVITCLFTVKVLEADWLLAVRLTVAV